MKEFKLITVLTAAILCGSISEAKKPDDLTCLTYLLKQSTDELNGKKPAIEEWLKRVVAVENSVLFLHKLTKAEKNKVIGYYVLKIGNDPNLVSDIERLINHLCMTEISDSEREWLAEGFRKEIGLDKN